MLHPARPRLSCLEFLGIVVSCVTFQGCFIDVANDNSHNAAVQIRLSCLCFALGFLLLLRVRETTETGEDRAIVSLIFLVLSRIAATLPDSDIAFRQFIRRERDKGK